MKSDHKKALVYLLFLSLLLAVVVSFTYAPEHRLVESYCRGYATGTALSLAADTEELGVYEKYRKRILQNCLEDDGGSEFE